MPFDGATYRPDPPPAPRPRSAADILRGWSPAPPAHVARWRSFLSRWARRLRGD